MLRLIVSFLICMVFCQSSYGQTDDLLCDSVNYGTDLNVFNLAPIKSNTKKKKISLCYNEGKLTNLLISERKNNTSFSVYIKDEIKMITKLDTSHRGFGPKSLFDTTIIAGKNILHQKNFINAGSAREIVAIDFEVVRINSQGDCELISYRVNNNFSVMNFANYFSSDSIFNVFSGIDISYQRQVKLESRNETYYYKGHSLFQHLLKGFLDFYLSGL